MPKFKCKYCHNDFYKERKNHIYKFCSLSCCVSYNNTQRKKAKLVKCEVCNKEFYKTLAEIKRRPTHYCSRECYYISIKDDEYPDGLVKCKNCGKIFKTKPSKIKRSILHFCSNECNGMYMSGKNHPKWVGGYNRKYGNGWKEVKKIIRKRDKKCMYCGTRNKMEVHHIIPFRISKNNNIDNLICLCKSCHPHLENLYNYDIIKYVNIINSIMPGPACPEARI